MRFLIDECLSPRVALRARDLGFDATHVAWIGESGTPDWDLVDEIVDGDWTLVTRNSRDFRGSDENPGDGGEHANLPIHAGLICLNDPNMNRDSAIELFERALAELENNDDLVNQVIEIFREGEELRVLRYTLTREEG